MRLNILQHGSVVVTNKIKNNLAHACQASLRDLSPAHCTMAATPTQFEADALATFRAINPAEL
jgi:hypothetical protein